MYYITYKMYHDYFFKRFLSEVLSNKILRVGGYKLMEPSKE